MRFLSTFTLLGALAISSAAHAATFTFTATGSGGGFSGVGNFLATPNGDGSFTITGISGTGITGLIQPGLFNNNDNQLFPSSPTLVDTKGFAFTDVMGNTGFKVDIFSNGVGTYQANLLDSDGVSLTGPVTFNLTNTTPLSATPEPSGLVLLGTGILGFAGMARRRFFA